MAKKFIFVPTNWNYSLFFVSDPVRTTTNIVISDQSATPPATTTTTKIVNPRLIRMNPKSDMMLTSSGIKCCICIVMWWCMIFDPWALKESKTPGGNGDDMIKHWWHNSGDYATGFPTKISQMSRLFCKITLVVKIYFHDQHGGRSYEIWGRPRVLKIEIHIFVKILYNATLNILS